MISQEVYVKNPTGLHARPANMFVKTAAQFPCKVNIQKGTRSFNGKSIVSVITIICDGDQEEKAMRAIVNAVESGLGE